MKKLADKVEILAERDIVSARRMGRAIARELGFTTVDQSRIATGISELARNIFLYAGKGTIHICQLDKNGRRGIQIVAEDQGPGIPDTRLAMLDGFSSSNGLGMGLPGTQRLMDEFYLNSQPDVGTKVVVRKWLY